MADFTIQEWMDTDDPAQKDAIVTDMAGSMDLGVLSMQAMVHEFQFYLADNATPIQAANGMELLSKILSKLQGDLIRADVHLLVEYLSARFQNHEELPNNPAGIRWTANALHSLAKKELRFTKGDASIIAQSVFKLPSTLFREQLAVTRLAVFELLDFLVVTYAKPIARDMGTEPFVEGLVGMAEFEKDPRCLKVLFQIFREIGQEWTLQSRSIELIWESYVRYFPITMKAADSSIPTREELQLLLVGCFTSNDQYATHAFPYLVRSLDDKQDTLSVYVKNTVLETFEACVTAYSLDVIARSYSEIWDALKFEIWDGDNDEYVDRALKVLEAISRKLDNHTLDWEATSSPLAQYILTTSVECCRRLQDTKQQHVLGSGKILGSIASCSPLGCNLVIKSVLPKLFVFWDDATTKDKKTPLLSVFNEILRARLDLQSSLPNSHQNLAQTPNSDQYMKNTADTLTSSLAAFQHSLIDDVLINAMMDPDSEEPEFATPYKLNAIKGLVVAARIKGFLADFHKRTVILEFSKGVVNHQENTEIHLELLRALQQISVEDIAGFRDLTLATIMAELPDRLNSEAPIHVLFSLNSLIKIACTATYEGEQVSQISSETAEPSHKFRLFEELQMTLLKKLHAVLSFSDQLPYANAILAAIYHGVQLFDQVLEQKRVVGELPASLTTNADPYSWIVLNVLEHLACQRPHEGGPLQGKPYITLNVNSLDPTAKESFFNILGHLSTLVLRSRQTTPSNNFLLKAEKEVSPSQIWSLFCKDQVAVSIQDDQQNLEHGPQDKYLANVLSMSLVAGLRPGDKERMTINIGNTALSMIKNAITSNDSSPFARLSMIYFMQLLVNKFGAAREIVASDNHTLVQVMLDLVATSNTKADELVSQRTYQTLAYFAAACLAAGDISVNALIVEMISGINDSVVGRRVAQSFRLLLAPSEIMNEHNFCVVRKLRKQRLFHVTFEKLVALWRESKSKDLKESYLIALAGVFVEMDPKIIEDNVEAIFPIVIESTNVDDDHTMLTSLRLIRQLVEARSDIAATYLDSIISRMTDRTHNTLESPSDASVKCRVAALEVLAFLVSHMEKEVLLRRKAKIMIELDVSLDDCSRTVRSAAERTKMKWFNLSEA